ncbi:MAG: repressor LexA [Caldithrix sp. RBG_13_44_9]|nr:MAG: repressor LexA [Caldithrix sp. RBG_13_44_9]
MKEITQRQKAVLQFIAEYIGQFGYPPTFQEIADAFGLVSKHGVVRHLEALERKGYITRSDTLARSIRIVHPQYQPPSEVVQVPLVGRVAAGYPILAEENIEDHVMLPRTLVKSEGRYFALRVQGDSMANAGILDGDMVVVQSSSMAQAGEIVVALVGDEVTVKRLVIQNNHKFLQAENPVHPNIYPQSEWSIQGKVVGLIRDNIQ